MLLRDNLEEIVEHCGVKLEKRRKYLPAILFHYGQFGPSAEVFLKIHFFLVKVGSVLN